MFVEAVCMVRCLIYTPVTIRAMKQLNLMTWKGE